MLPRRGRCEQARHKTNVDISESTWLMACSTHNGANTWRACVSRVQASPPCDGLQVAEEGLAVVHKVFTAENLLDDGVAILLHLHSYAWANGTGVRRPAGSLPVAFHVTHGTSLCLVDLHAEGRFGGSKASVRSSGSRLSSTSIMSRFKVEATAICKTYEVDIRYNHHDATQSKRYEGYRGLSRSPDLWRASQILSSPWISAQTSYISSTWLAALPHDAAIVDVPVSYLVDQRRCCCVSIQLGGLNDGLRRKNRIAEEGHPR